MNTLARPLPLTTKDPAVLDDLLEHVANELQAGRTLDVEAFIQAHPGHADDLRRLLPAMLVMAELQRSLAPGPAANGALPALDGKGPPLGTLGDFQILREVGRGGMGVVYEATQVSLNRRVALKVLPFASTLDSRQLQRFKNEAQAAACLHHTNIVPVYATGVERGVHFYAMQFIDGHSLAEVIETLKEEGTSRKGAKAQRRSEGEHAKAVKAEDPKADAHGFSPSSLAPSRLCVSTLLASLSTQRSTKPVEFYRTMAELGIQAAEALEYAHQMCIVHRDIKPGNLMIDQRSNLWIMDFGLAQIQTDTKLTMSGDLLGTLRYMSPEQALGKRVMVDHRTDIYSLGVTLYELLTLQPAFDGKDRQEILRQIAFEEPKPPRRINKAIPAELETIVLKAMEKEAEDRYETIGEMARDLRSWLEEKPIRARKPGVVQRVRKWGRRHPSLVGTTLVVLVLAAVGLAVSHALITQEQGRTSEAEAGRKDAQQKLELAHYYQTVALAARERAAGRLRTAEQLLCQCRREKPDWEWHYAMRLRYGTPLPLPHSSHLFCAACSPDGRFLAVGDSQGTITLWDARTCQRLHAWTGHDSWVRGLAFSRDSRLLASAGWDGKVTVWEPESRGLMWSADGGYRVDCLAFSPDGRRLASSWNHDGSVRIWEASSGRLLYAFRAHSSHVFSMAFSPDGGTLATGSADQTVALWDTASWARNRTLSGHVAMILGVAFSPDGTQLAAASGDFYLNEHRGELKVWDVRTGVLRQRLCGPNKSVFTVAFSPDGRRLASGGSEEPSVRIWDVENGVEAFALRGHTDAIWGLVFGPDGSCLFSASGDHTVRVWDATPMDQKPGLERHMLGPFRDSVTCVAFHPRDSVLAAGSQDGAITLWDAASGQMLHALATPDEAPASMAFSSDGELLAVSSTSGKVRVWDTHSWRELRCFHHDEVAMSVAFSPDNQRLAAAVGKRIEVCDPRTGRALGSLTGHTDHLLSVAYSPDGRWLASAGFAGEVRIWAVGTETGSATGALFRTLPSHAGRVSCVAFSPKGQRLVSVGSDGLFQLWDTLTWTSVTRFQGHLGRVHRVVFSPDGKQLASAGADGTVRVWEAATGRPLLVFRGHADGILSVAWSPDGRWLASASLDRTVKIWDAQPPPDSPARTALDPGQ